MVVFGDFNSRVAIAPEERCEKGNEGSRTAGCVPSEDSSRKWLQKDEMLCHEFESLQGFHESEVRFPPTFGYIPGSRHFGRRHHPAWCDRVVCSAAAGVDVDSEEYDAFLGAMRTSDHRPVAAEFKVSRKC